ncbi:MAG: hypothetical protein HYU84_13230 [Chloroflexi bacterium]|nr:hypothetical protein [Chloroflexota bacterium]
MKREIKSLGRSVMRPVVTAFYIMSAVLIAAYIVLYQYTPLEAVLNDVLLNSIISLSALAAALISTFIFLQYQPEDNPRRVWQNIMIAGWLWFLGELLWQIYAYFNDSVVPVPSLADASWVGGFVFYTFAFYHQYMLIVPSQKDTIRTYAIGAWLVAMLIPAAYLTITDSFSLAYFIEFYYPFADLAVGLAGLLLVFIFHGGALMRPWIGLMVFGLSDLLYAWAEKTQMYSVSAENGNLISLVIDTTYLAAYLV